MSQISTRYAFPSRSAQTRPQPGEPAERPLMARVVRGAAWAFLGKLLARGMSLARVIVLARLLSPADFGLFGIVLLAIATVDTFTSTGFDTALIQRRNDTDACLDTAWTVGLVRGFVLAAIIYAGAPLVSAFFNAPKATPLLRVMCISVAMGGFVNVGTIYFRKDLQFHKQVLWDTTAAFIGLVVGIVLACRLRSVWALVWSGLAGSLVTCLLSYLLHPYRPRLRFDAARARELYRFGRWVLGGAALIFLVNGGGDAFVGKVLGVAALGVYQMAYRISSLAATEITHVVAGVTFPTYSMMQDDVPRLRAAYGRVLGLTMLVAAPIAAATAAAAPTFVPLVLGARWTAAVAPIQVLCLFGLLRAYGATTGSVVYAMGNPRYEALASFLQLLALGLLIWPAASAAGLVGVCVVVVAGGAIADLCATWYTAGLLRLPVRSILAGLWLPLAASGAVALLVAAMGAHMERSLWSLGLQALAGLALYALLVGRRAWPLIAGCALSLRWPGGVRAAGDLCRRAWNSGRTAG